MFDVIYVCISVGIKTQRDVLQERHSHIATSGRAGLDTGGHSPASLRESQSVPCKVGGGQSDKRKASIRLLGLSLLSKIPPKLHSRFILVFPYRSDTQILNKILGLNNLTTSMYISFGCAMRNKQPECQNVYLCNSYLIHNNFL